VAAAGDFTWDDPRFFLRVAQQVTGKVQKFLPRQQMAA
jgi:hypothetical protein